jgi:hypothetical protein
MFRFTIRDVLCLTVVAAVVAAWCADRNAIKRERLSLDQQREALASERASHQATMTKSLSLLRQVERGNVAKMQQLRSEMQQEQAQFFAQRVTEAERERAKQTSMELGAPQPAPLPSRFGESSK